MKHNLIFIFTMLIIIVSSCNESWTDTSEEDCYDPDYSNCNFEEPRISFLKVYLTINEENPKVLLKIYDGDIEYSTVRDSFIVDTSYIEYEASFDTDYSVTAKYIKGQDTIIAVDGTKIKKYSSSYCDSTCWSVSGQDISVELKD